VIILIVAIAYAGFKYRKKIAWREILVPMFFITILALLGLAILFLLQGVKIDFETVTPEILQPEIRFEGPPLGPVTPNLIGLVWIGLAAGLILFGAWIFFRAGKRAQPGDLIKQEAEQAIRDLQTGSDLKSVILRCYLQMSQALLKERGIKLEETMTARDFEGLLEARGIPRDPVRQLTRLFEGARYGFRQPGPEDERQALDCLNAIVQYSRATGQPD